MREIQTDYLVIGAGASGMAFVDALIASSDAEVVMVDRRHRPGGHWVDAYPFVRLHQPSAYYGVNSRMLGCDRIDKSGPNAGFYERATALEICDYYGRVLEEHMLPSGQVRFFGMCDYRGDGSDGHHFVSSLTGETTTVKVRRRLVDATYTESSVPSRHTPAFDVDPGVRLVPPNDLVRLAAPASGYTVIGAGKTSMDTCAWLLDRGVAPDSIRWIRSREGWVIDRTFTQPLALVGGILEYFSRMVEAAAAAEGASDLMHRLADHGALVRLDPDVEPAVFRGAVLSKTEIESLRRIENVVRQGRVRRISTDRITFEQGFIPTDPNQIYVDCTAAGLNPAPMCPIFEPNRITMQFVTLGVVPSGAALLGFVEASRNVIAEKNHLCPPVGPLGEVSSMLRALYVGLRSQAVRMADPDLAAWSERSRLNPIRGVTDHLDDPRVQAAFARLAENMEAAMTNLDRLLQLAHC